MEEVGRGGAEYAVLLLCAVYHNPLPTLLNKDVGSCDPSFAKLLT